MSLLDRVQAWHLPKDGEVVEAAPARIVPSAPVGVHPTGWGTGIERLAPFTFAPPEGLWSREAAMSVPTISRARDLICSAVGALPFVLYTMDFANPELPVEQKLPPAPWMGRPDPSKTRNWMLAWTTDDLFFYARAYWRIVDRYATGYPKAFMRMPTPEVNVDRTGRVTWNSEPISIADVVEFLSPIEGLLYCGYRTISIALKLDAAADRFANCEVPAGWLAQKDGSEPMSSAELIELAGLFAQLRRTNSIAALNNVTEYHESSLDPSRLQLAEARQFQSLELARVANIPPSLVGAPSGTGMTYNNTTQAKQDLVDFGAAPLINCIEQTLAGPNVVPSGQAVRLDLNAWLRNPYVDLPTSANDLQQAFNTPTSNGSQP